MPKPTPAQTWKAIELYLGLAYGGPPPGPISARVEALHHVPEAEFYASGVFEHSPQAPGRFALRLGNRHYPHMKLVIERRPDGKGFLFRADAHDRHCCPAPSSREYPMFCALMEQNQTISQSIEAAWDAAGIPTFKSYLRDDLDRRRTHPEPPAPAPADPGSTPSQ